MSGNKHIGQPIKPSRYYGDAQADPVMIGLRKLFEPMLAEPVPDSFRALLDQIDAKQARKDRDGD